VRDIDQSDFALAHAAGATVVDIREPGEYVAGHVPGAVLLPMSQLGSRVGELDRGQRLLIICATGNRSAAMTDALRAAGYDAWNVLGGTAAWARSGRPLDTGLPASG
jgi:rhodanese-related sulfurtransferase